MNRFVELPPFLFRPISLGAVTMPFSLWELVLQFALPTLGAGLAVFLAFRLLRRLVRRTAVQEESKTRILRWLRRGARLLWLVALIVLGGRLLGAELVKWSGMVLRVLNQPFFTSGNTEVSVVTLVMVVPVFYFAGWLSRTTRRMLETGVIRRLNLDPLRAVSLLNVIRVVVLGLTVILGLSIIGINLSSLAVLFGVLGIGVGFGLQDAVADMFAGIVIMFARPIKEGDRVLVEEHEGTVHQIKLLHSVINTITHETIIIPNSKITGNSMHNYSYDDARIILCNTVQVSYGSDLDRVGQVLLEMAQRNPWAIEGMDPRYQVWSFDDSGITVRICTWIHDARDRIPAYSWTNLEIWRAFRANGIEIPFPQMDLHVKDVARRSEPPTTESGGDLGSGQ